MLTVRNLPEELHRGLKARAARHGRSMEAEVRAILASVLASGDRIKLGSLLADIGREAQVSDDEVDVIDQVRDKSPAEPENFG